MPFPNPFSSLRFGNIMGQGVDRSDMSGFNPALKTSQSPSNNMADPSSMSKRFFTNTIPDREPQFRPDPAMMSSMQFGRPTPDIPQQPPPQQAPPGGIQAPSGIDDYTTKFFDLLQKASKDRPAQSAYEKMLNEPPDAGKYQPSRWRRLASSLAGAASGFSSGPGAGIAAGEHILTSPYRAAISDYDYRLQGAQRAAELEHRDVSDYRANLTSAADFGIKRGGQDLENFYKGVTAAQKSREIDVTARKAETDAKQASNQLARWISQSNNEAERNRLAGIKNEIDKGSAEALAEYHRTMGGAAQRQAGAAETRAGAAVTAAGAAKTRADKYQAPSKMPTIQEAQRARNLVLEEMYGEDRYSNYIDINQDEYGPVYTLKAGKQDAALEKEIKKRIAQKIAASYPDFASGEYSGIEEEEPDAADMGDFILGPLTR